MKPMFFLLALFACDAGGSSPTAAETGGGDSAADSAASVVGWVEVTNQTTELLDLVTVITPEHDWIDWSGTPLSLAAGTSGTVELSPGDSWGLAFRTGDRCAFTPYFDVGEGSTTQAAVRYIEGVWSEGGGCEITD
jgi:hypothetical protein